VDVKSRAGDKVLCSIGVGPHAELLDLTRPTFEAYATRHGYDLDLRTELVAPDRPASWNKIPLLRELLGRYKVVMWVDADAAIVDASEDIVEPMGQKLVAMAAHSTPEGDHVPNCGVLAVRSHRKVMAFLDQVWDQARFTHHKWWENGAWLTLLGYQLEPQVRMVRPARMYQHTAFLSNEWNSVPVDSAEFPRIVHCAGQDHATRLRILGDLVGDPVEAN
jgi:hypothetical protein